MKEAKASDYWRRLIHDKPTISLDEFLSKGIRGLEERTISAKGALNVLCGANGTGKSTILEAIYLALRGERPYFHFGTGSRFNQAKLSAQVRIKATAKQCLYPPPLAVDSLPEDVEISWLNPGSLSAFLQREYSSTINFAELLEGSPTRAFTSDELQEISYLVGRNYSDVQVTEIEDFGGTDSAGGYEGLDVLPYFSVRTDAVKYSSEDMGIGEHALFLLFWYTRRISEHSLLFIEELETHISFRSQVHVLNDLVRQSLERKIWILITTHSPAILQRVPLNYVKLCVRSEGKLLISENPSDTELALALGVRPERFGVCIVEDAAAKAFLIALFQRLRRDCALEFEVVVAGSASNIDAALTNFPKVSGWLKIIGVYDAGFSITAKNLLHNVVNLPGKKSPELDAIEAVRNNIGLFSKSIDMDEPKVRVVIATLEGLDEHDWFAELVKGLGINYETGMRGVLASWLSIEGNHTAAMKFLETFS